MAKIFLTITPAGTKKVGKDLAKKISKTGPQKTALVLALEGDLGSGKTTFLQGFAAGLGIKDKILSPTFVILKRFKLEHPEFKNFYHIDCYRIKNADDFSVLDPDKKMFHPENIVAIEWPKNAGEILPEELWKIKFEFVSDKKRKITFPDNFYGK